MKAKEKVLALQEVLQRGCYETSTLATRQSEDTEYFFDVTENPSRKVEGDTYYGLTSAVIIRQDGKDVIFKKFFDRSYKLAGRSLNTVREVAYTELLDIIIATYLLSALNTPTEVLQEASNPTNHE